MSDARKRYIAERLAAAWNAEHPVNTAVICFGPDDGDMDDFRETVVTSPAQVGPGGTVPMVGVAEHGAPLPLTQVYGVAKLQREIEAQVAREGVA
ncbi:MAG: hypothetical protein F9K32_16665 [Desulfobulbaceae bacterium]|nr:MAG: hypothetical protein F9K32_16665 [Desulfobulbaceae bacterium]